MSKTFTLLKANLANSYGLNRLSQSYNNGKRVGGRAVFMAAIIVIAAITVISAIFGMFYLLAQQLHGMGRLPQLLGIIAASAGIGSFVLSFTKAPGHLYAAKDFEMLIGLPVGPGAILGSKILALYLSGLIPGLVVALPGIAAYGQVSGDGPLFYALGFALSLFIPLIPMLGASLIAFPIAFIGAKFRFSNIIIIVLYMAITVLVFVGSYALPMVSPEQLAAAAVSIDSAAGLYPPADWFARALGNGEYVYGLLFVGSSVALFAVFSGAFARVYRRIISALGERHTNKRFKLGQIKVSGVVSALLNKEVKTYFSSYMYVLNTSIGMVMFTVYIIAMCVMGYESVAALLELPDAAELYLGVTAMVGAICVSMSAISAPSISIEGSSLWILKSLPIRFWDIARAKIALCLMITAPLTLLNTTVLAITTRTGFAAFAGLSLALLALCVFVAALGIVINLYFPKLDWKNPIQVVKQSASVILTMILSVAAAFLLMALHMLTRIELKMYLYLAALALAVLDALLFAFIYARGQKLFEKLM